MRVASAAVLGLVLGLIGPVGPQTASAKDDPSQLTKVSINRADDDIAVVVRGSQPPNFTSFTLSDPFRVVLDWAGSQLAGVQLRQQFDRGLIRLVQMRQFSSESEQISRVIVELAQPTTYRVEADGTAVIMHFAPVALPPPPAPEPVPDEPTDPTEPEPAEPLDDDLLDDELEPLEDLEPLDDIDETPPPKPTPPAPKPAPPPPPPAQPLARPAPPPPPRRADPTPKIDEVDDSLDDDLFDEEPDDLDLEPLRAPRAQRASRKPAPRPAPPPPVVPQPRRPAPELTRTARTPPPDAFAPTDTPDEDADKLDSPDQSDPGRRRMTYIGFKQMAGTSRVFVRLDGKAAYRQKMSGGSTFVVELLNTSVPLK
ncbi:MAG: AMIN domain-containing protein, partial [Myxococcota bacterium]